MVVLTLDKKNRHWREEKLKAQLVSHAYCFARAGNEQGTGIGTFWPHLHR